MFPVSEKPDGILILSDIRCGYRRLKKAVSYESVFRRVIILGVTQLKNNMLIFITPNCALHK